MGRRLKKLQIQRPQDGVANICSTVVHAAAHLVRQGVKRREPLYPWYRVSSEHTPHRRMQQQLHQGWCEQGGRAVGQAGESGSCSKPHPARSHEHSRHRAQRPHARQLFPQHVGRGGEDATWEDKRPPACLGQAQKRSQVWGECSTPLSFPPMLARAIAHQLLVEAQQKAGPPELTDAEVHVPSRPGNRDTGNHEPPAAGGGMSGQGRAGAA